MNEQKDQQQQRVKSVTVTKLACALAWAIECAQFCAYVSIVFARSTVCVKNEQPYITRAYSFIIRNVCNPIAMIFENRFFSCVSLL